jgi:NAD(P)-dependent dehydrogenase (short-subunit alcohol dehydrogenase family)
MSQTLLIVGIRNLGREIALHFAAQGWQVIAAARTQGEVEGMARAVDAAGGHGVPMVLDLTQPSTLEPLASLSIDLCVAAQTAGGRFGPKPLLDIDDEELPRGFAAYVQGTWNLLKAVGPGLISRRRGSFLQMGTSSGVRTKEGFAVLGAVQAGLRALVQVAAREWRPHNVHVAYLPIDGGIESERSRQFLPEDKSLPPREIARACQYLHEQDARAWTHELMLRPVGGDWTAPY